MDISFMQTYMYIWKQCWISLIFMEQKAFYETGIRYLYREYIFFIVFWNLFKKFKYID